MQRVADVAQKRERRPGVAGAVERHQLVVFFALVFPLSWVLVPFTSGEGINPTGPLFSALIVTALVAGRRGVREWLRRVFAVVGSWRWYVAAVGIVVGLNILALLLALLLGASRPSSDDLAAWPEPLIVFPFYLLLIALPEESGWRGFAMPRLAERWGKMGGTAVLGVLIAIWHVPLVIAGSQVGVILAAVFASQFLFTWLQEKTEGSIPVVMVAHASQGGLAGAYIGPMLSGSDETLELSLLTVLLALVAAAVAWTRMRGRLPESPPVPQ
jgi:membrane protease YdiL (CAAX protease family)